MSYIESIKSYIEDLFGGNIEIRNFTDKDNLPNYLKNRLDFYEFKYYGVVFLIISYLYDEIVNISEIKNTLKQLRKYLDTNTKIVCIFNDLSNYTRKKLIEEKISFVVSGKQIYIPYLGIAYSNHISTRYEVNYSSRNNSIKKISPSAQALFFELITINSHEPTQIELSEKLGLTTMSISRAYKELKTLNILDDIRIIRIKETLTSQRVEQVWNKVKNYLFNPIQSVVYIEKDSLEYDLRKKLTYSGETALSDYTMLIQPREETFAIYKREWDILKESAILVPYKTDYCYIIELWKHKVPLLYNKIHPLALYLSMKDSSDERIRGELEILLENYFRS